MNFNIFFDLALVFIGIFWMIKRNIGFGVEGKPASFYISGIAAFAIGFLTFMIGVFMVFSS